MGTSVDINLDNLSPYSKGIKTPNPNIPMNVLKSNQTQFNSPIKPPLGATTPGMSINTSSNLFNFGTPPMSPNSNQSTSTSANKNSNFNDLDDLFK